jgi:hypothetical protein
MLIPYRELGCTFDPPFDLLIKPRLGCTPLAANGAERGASFADEASYVLRQSIGLSLRLHSLVSKIYRRTRAILENNRHFRDCSSICHGIDRLHNPATSFSRLYHCHDAISSIPGGFML